MINYDVEKTQAPRPFPELLNRGDQYCTQSSTLDNLKNSDPFDELFTYHPPSEQDVLKYAAINQAARNFAEVVRANCPYSADYKDAVRKIREARMIANAAIALKGRGI